MKSLFFIYSSNHGSWLTNWPGFLLVACPGLIPSPFPWHPIEFLTILSIMWIYSGRIKDPWAKWMHFYSTSTPLRLLILPFLMIHHSTQWLFRFTAALLFDCVINDNLLQFFSPNRGFSYRHLEALLILIIHGFYLTFQLFLNSSTFNLMGKRSNPMAWILFFFFKFLIIVNLILGRIARKFSLFFHLVNSSQFRCEGCRSLLLLLHSFTLGANFDTISPNYD